MNRRVLFAIVLLSATIALYYIGLPSASEPPKPEMPAVPPAPQLPSEPAAPEAKLETKLEVKSPEPEPEPEPRTEGSVPSAPPVMPAKPEAPPPAAPPPAAPVVPAMPAEPAVAVPVSEDAVVRDLEEIHFAIRDFRQVVGENPVGTNAEIVKTLMGDNVKQVKISLPAGNSLNEDGELLDRWGKPYFFHQVSKTEMEIRSAGPDGKMWTADDMKTK